MRTLTTAATLAAAAVLSLTACNDNKPAVPGDKPAAPSVTASPAAETAVLPSLVGKGLQAAQDEAQAAGFYGLTSHDALGRGRLQALDRNWKVCTQTPQPGTHATDVTVDFGAVKLEEACPASDAGEPEAAGDTMPDLVGKSVKVARQTLPSSTSLSVRDSTELDRLILVESNWKVCRLSPAAGAKLDGRPVVIDAVKFDEDC
ncbi:PASTA domain-containing protein [Streptomyces sp. SYSU K21746]